MLSAETTDMHRHDRIPMSSVSLTLVDKDWTLRRRAKLLGCWIGLLVLFSIVQYGFTERGSPRSILLIDLAWTVSAAFAVRQSYLTAVDQYKREYRAHYEALTGVGEKKN